MIHCGFVGILGLPNAGKSTFLNKLLGEKISIVSNKPQTTRRAFTGLLSTKEYQLIFLDAPGFVEPKAGLFNYLHKEFQRVIEQSELLLVLVSHEQKENEAFKKFYSSLKESKKNIKILFTKTDLPESDFVKTLKRDFDEKQESYGEWSVKKQASNNVDEFLKTVSLELKPEEHPLYDPEMISLDRTRDIVAEFIRETCFLQLDQEIPFGLGVIIKSFKREKGLRHIQANILVEKENHKGIVIGKSGSQLKKIGQASREKIQELLGEKIFLGLHVSHKKNWTRKNAIMKEVGYSHES